MLRRARIKDHYQEQRLFSQRAFASAAVIAVGILALIARLVFLQIVRYDYFTEQSQGNRIRIEPLPPSRGIIFDRSGIPLALNAPSYQLELTREQVPNLDSALRQLADLQLLDRDDVPGLKRDILRRRSFEAVPLKLNLNDDELARFAVRQQDFPGVEIRPRLTRNYPLGGSAVHALGYVSSISEDEQKKIDMNEYAGTSLIGKAGVEKRYEAELHGSSGYQQLMVNAQGRRVDDGTGTGLKRREPIAGNDLYLTINERLQQVAEEMLRDKRGAVIAIDPNNGDVLALVSTPGFDPNTFARGITRSEYRGFMQDPDKPLIDRVLRGVYPSGSTIKPFMALAALEYNIIEADDSKFCTGSFRLPGVSRPWRDWKRQGHGNVDMRRAIAVSCDVYFYSIGNVMGVDRMHEFLDKFGFGRTSGIDIDGELKALLPSTDWKRKAFKRRENQVWYPGDTISVSIGQGYLTVTPMQLAQATAILAMRGKGYQPRLVRAIRDAKTGKVTELPAQPLEPFEVRDAHNWDVIFEGMKAVVSPGGTAYSAFGITPYTSGGKTGTAQVAAMAQGVKYDAKAVAERLRDHGLYIAFAPLEAPKIAIAAIIENGEHGTAAAPIARRLIDHVLLPPDQLAAQEAKRQALLAKQQAAAAASDE